LTDFSVQTIAEPILFDLEVVADLKVQPEALAHAKETRQAKSSVGADRPLAMNDLVDTTSGDSDVLGEAILAQPHRPQKLLEKDLSGVYRREFLAHCVLSWRLVIIHDLNVMGITCRPTETDAPLVIDSDAELSLAITVQALQPIPWWHS